MTEGRIPGMTRRNRSRQTVRRRERTSRGVVWVAGSILVLVLVVSFFFDEMGVSRYLEMLDRARGLEQEIQALEKANVDLRTDIARIQQQDPIRIEELARERLGFVLKGERVYQVVEEEPQGARGR